MLKQPSLSQAQRRAYIVAFILSSNKVISSCSYCEKEELVYIAIAAPSSRQPSFYSKCTSINMRFSYNIHSVSNAKYISHISYLLCGLSHLTNKKT